MAEVTTCKGAVLLAGKAALLGGRLHEAEDGRVVGLGGTGGEDDLIGAPGAQGPGRAAPSAFQKVEGGAPHPVQGVGVGVHGQVGAGPGTWKGAMAPAASAHRGAVAA